MKESVDRKARLVFTDRNLLELQEAVLEAFSVFRRILSEPCLNYRDLQDRLSLLDDGTWSTIRTKFLHDHKQRGADNSNVVVLLLDFITTIDKCTRTMKTKIEEYDSHTVQMDEKLKFLEGNIKELEASLHDKDQQLQSKTMAHAEMMAENAGLTAKNAYIQKLLDEKNNRITELERSSNVQLWEQEKRRAMKDSIDRIEELESVIDDYKHGRESAIQKLKNLDSTYKKRLLQEKLKDHGGHDGDDVTQLARKSYIQDKDIVYLERQLYDLQANTVGFVGGMKTDFNKLCNKFVKPGGGGVDKDFVQLSSRMDQVCTAMATGSVEQVQAVLPPHYKYIEGDKFQIRRIKRLSQPTLDTTQLIVKYPAKEGEATKSAKLNDIAEERPANPVIVNPRNKRLHAINPLKYFPHMSQKFILEQYGSFNEFDSNGDGVLDLTEVVKVVTQLGFTFSVHELQEAMEEVDRDGNHTLDFYEYLLVIDNIYRKTGKAQLFRDGIIQINQNAASKSCSIQ